MQQFASDKVWSDKLSELVLSLFWFFKVTSSIQINYFENLIKLPLSPLIYCIFWKNVVVLQITRNRLCTVCEDDSPCTPSGKVFRQISFLIHSSDKFWSDKKFEAILLSDKHNTAITVTDIQFGHITLFQCDNKI